MKNYTQENILNYITNENKNSWKVKDIKESFDRITEKPVKDLMIILLNEYKEELKQFAYDNPKGIRYIIEHFKKFDSFDLNSVKVSKDTIKYKIKEKI